ncbi:hypothetical protein FALBO_669 [Fusarium albosuccineum]|uniref:Uncharacterized protein n=1 Tax=Fusarium albosuccineum TaxID=1237068 RepID=A0A8H4LQ36_9HYPO|nr:hypothetical protein FALBO_669 [Fusarium albosuccineum]
MLRRNSSRKKGRRPLSRSKSTSSVLRSPVHAFEFIDPIAAERDANIAALLSYYRAQGRPSSEMSIPRDPASFFPENSDGTASVVRHSMERSDSATSRHGTSANVSQQQSVRFAGPSARPKRTLASRASAGRNSPAKASSRLHVGNSSTRPSSTLSFRETPDDYSFTRRYLESLQPPDACYSPEDDTVSMPASFRRLRKSKSMLSSSRPTTRDFSNTTMPAKGHLPPTDSLFKPANDENRPLRERLSRTTGLKASPSMSFLKNRRGMTASRPSSRIDNELAVQLAREKFRAQMEEQEKLKTKSSMLFRARNRRGEGSTGLRKSLRSSSNNSTVPSTASQGGIPAPKHPGLRRTARKVSDSLRSKLKGLFTRGKSNTGSEEQGDEPEVDEHGSDGESCLRVSNEGTTEEASMARVASRVPSLHDVPSNQQLRSRKGSVESLNSSEQHVADDRSRVTSWTDSATNTISSVGMLGEWERQRLSVIKENGTHISSSSLHPAELKECGIGGQEILSGLEIDSERVYSALMKRLGEKSPERQRDRASLDASKLPPESVPDRKSSNHQTPTLPWASSTIRCVRAEDDVFGEDGDDSSITTSSSSERLVTDHTAETKPIQTLTTDWAASDDRASQHGSILSGLEPPRTMTHRSSAFFASPTCHSFRSQSPYRRALKESAKTSPECERVGFPESRYLHSLSALSLPTRRNSSAGSERDVQAGDTESVYSCTTEDAKLAVAGSVSVALSQTEHPTCSHNDVALVSEPLSYCSAQQHQRDMSTGSSVEWKTWLSSKVSKLEEPLTPSKRDAGTHKAGMLPPLGHVREGAEMGSSPEFHVRSGALNRRPLSDVKGNAQLVKDSQTTTQSPRRVLAGQDENESPTATHTYLKGRPPSIPPRSTLRAVPSLPTVSSSNTGLPGEVHRMRSLNTIGRLNSTPEEAIAKRRSRARISGWQGSPTKSSPGVGATTLHLSPSQRSGCDSSYSTPKTQLGWDKLGKDGTGAKGPELDAQVMGSKTMVDMFLNSRRKRADGGLGSSPAAFL